MEKTLYANGINGEFTGKIVVEDGTTKVIAYIGDCRVMDSSAADIPAEGFSSFYSATENYINRELNILAGNPIPIVKRKRTIKEWFINRFDYLWTGDPFSLLVMYGCVLLMLMVILNFTADIYIYVHNK